MMQLTQTQFWIIAVLIIVVMAFAGYAINRWAMKPYKPDQNLWYIIGGAVVGIIVVFLLWWFWMKDKKEPANTNSNLGTYAAQLMTSPVMM